MTSTFHLLLVLSLHGPAAHADVAVQADRLVAASDQSDSNEVVFAEEVEDSEDDRSELGWVVLLAWLPLDDRVDHELHVLPAPTRGDAVATHSARGPPAA